MLTGIEYIERSIELNLFFLRIMKEHLLHVMDNLTFRDRNLVQPLADLKDSFDKLLIDTIIMANGIISPQALAAGDIITVYTYRAETMAQYLIGLPLGTNITMMEASLASGGKCMPNPMTEQSVNILNQNIIFLLEENTRTLRMLLANVLSCKMFLTTYTMLLSHLAEESEHYRIQLEALQRRQNLMDEPRTAASNEIFWNSRLAQHAEVAVGYLDPSEDELIQKGRVFTLEFEDLARAAGEAFKRPELLPEVTQRSMEATINIKYYKERILIGILECETRSRLFAAILDHVLREANHYLKELREFINMRR